MLPSEDAIWVGSELARRFGLPSWQFALTATDANRFAIRLARELTGRPKILVFNWCYHGTRRRDVRHARRRLGRRARRQRRSAGAARRDDASGRVERRRGARARARPRRRRLRARRACADEHRDRPPRARLPRRAARGDPRGRDAADHRRDAHDLRRPGRLHGRVRARARHAHDRQADRAAAYPRARTASRPRWPRGLEAMLPKDERADIGGIGGTVAGERPLVRGHARDARGGADRRGLRPDDRPRRALRGGRRRRDRAAPSALARHAPRLPGRVPLPSRAPAERKRGGRGRQRRARPPDPPLRAQPRDPADARSTTWR